MTQKLTLIYEPQFSLYSYGFRPKRGAIRSFANVRRFGFGNFFVTVNHSKLIEVLS